MTASHLRGCRTASITKPASRHILLWCCRGMDVYEEEGNLFFNDFTQFAAKDRLKAFDRKFQLLISFPQVLMTDVRFPTTGSDGAEARVREPACRICCKCKQSAMLQTLVQVLVTPHSAFLTMEALNNIASTTVENILAFQHGQELVNVVKPL